MLIYVSGPYTAPTLQGREENVEAAIRAGRELLDLGVWPFVPHFNHIYSQYFVRRGIHDLTHEQYLEWDEQILRRCDGLLKLGSSPGADYEENIAHEMGIPVFYSTEEVSRWHELTPEEVA